MRCYLAHPITDYGQPRQAQAVDLIEAAGFEVENPDKPIHDAGYKLGGMDYFTDIVSGCAALAFMRFQDGSIGAGVGKEIAAAQRAGIPIYDITDGSLAPNDAPSPILSVEKTRAMIAFIRGPKHEANFGQTVTNAA